MKITQRDYAAIVRRTPDHVEILLLHSQQIPSAQVDRHFWQTCEPANQMVADVLGVSVVTVRPLYTGFISLSPETGEVRTLYLMRYLDGQLAVNASWHTLDTLAELDTGGFISLEQLKSFLDMNTKPDWYSYGWYDLLLEASKSVTSSTPQQVRSWERSAIWRMPKHNGDNYLKICPAMFAHEVKLSQWLHDKFPDRVPEILPQILPDSIRTREYGQQDKHHDTLQNRCRALAGYAEIQRTTIDHVQELLDLGVPHRGLDWISKHIDGFFARNSHLKRGTHPLTDGEIAQCRAALQRLHQALSELRQSDDIPETLEHGDLWGGQIILYENSYLITDWSDSAVTFPFFSLSFYLAGIDSELPDDPSARESLTSAYLDTWLDVSDSQKLAIIYHNAQLLGDVYSAMRYHYDILPNMGQQWEMENMIAYNLRLFLEKLG